METIDQSEISAKSSEWDSLGDEMPFNPNTVRSVEDLRERVIDMKTAPEGEIASDFKSGIYLFHSAIEENVEKIFESGEILNAGGIYDREIEAKRKEMEGKSEEEITEEIRKISIQRNSGQEGISWSANGIDAMPGTPGKIAGFVAAPELVLGNDKLVIPSRPAPYELLQVSSEMDTKRFFEAKKQYEVWRFNVASIFESASVDSGFMRLIINIEYGDEDKFGLFDSFLRKFGERGGLPADELRKYYQITENGHIRIDEDLHQQEFGENYLPPAAVYLQAMIDQGAFSDSKLEGKDVVEVIDELRKDEELTKSILFKSRREGERYKNEYEAQLEKAKLVSAEVEDMYFVTNQNDLDKWLEVMKRTNHFPRGILLYDAEKVKKINFATEEKGDNIELANEIGRVVGADKNFWSEKMGMNLENISRAGSVGQVLKDSEVNHDVEIKIVDGRPEIIRL